MTPKPSNKLTALCLTIILPAISLAVLLFSIGYPTETARARANPELVQRDALKSSAVALLPHECEVYPLAVPEASLSGLQPNDTFELVAGSGSGNFQWLFWNPDDNSSPYLVAELENPALSLNDFIALTNFGDPDPTDRSLSTGDYIAASTGVNNSADINDAIENLIANGTTMRVVVFDNSFGTGAGTYVHSVGFIFVRIDNYVAGPGQTITFTYLGPAEDPEVCRNFGLALTTNQVQSGQPGQSVAYRHTLTNLGNYTETVVLTYITTPVDWSVSLTPLNSLLGPAQAITVTAVVSVPIDSLAGMTNVTRITATLPISSAISATVADTTTTIIAPDLAISKMGPFTAAGGALITYTLTITNSGVATATNLVITDALPAGATYITGGVRVGPVISWTIPGLAAHGGLTQTTFVVTATQTITNSNYRVSASGGYSATGSVPVKTTINDKMPGNESLYLPMILKEL